MSDQASAKNANTFKLALLTMLLSIWLLGRVSEPEVVEEPAENVAVNERVSQPSIVDHGKDDAMLPINPNTPGRIVGLVKFNGTKLSPPATRPSIDRNCAELYRGRESLLFETWVWGANDTVQNVLIHVSDGLPAIDWVIPIETTIIKMGSCRIEPHIATTRFGQLIEFRNEVGARHALVVNPKKSPNFEKELVGAYSAFRWVPNQPEVGIPIRSDNNDWMSGYIHVIDHPFFSVTGQQGSFEINDLPPGEYELSLWHEVKAFRESVQPVKVKIEPGKTTTVNFTIKPQSSQ